MILWSGSMIKINYKEKEQRRILMITNHCFYNLGGGDILHKVTGIMSKLFGDGEGRIRRKVPLELVTHISYSDYVTSSQFILHVPREFDYHFKGEFRYVHSLLLEEMSLFTSLE